MTRKPSIPELMRKLIRRSGKVMAGNSDFARVVLWARTKHGGQTREGGEPHFAHVLRVALRVLKVARRYTTSNVIYQAMIVAVCHDLLEDTETTEEEIAEVSEHFCGGVMSPNRVLKCVRSLTHVEEEEPDEVYLRRVAEAGKIAVLVKRCDRLDNLASLKAASREFRERKLKEVCASLPIWQEIDPVGAIEIEALLEEVEHESAAC